MNKKYYIFVLNAYQEQELKNTRFFVNIIDVFEEVIGRATHSTFR